VKLVDANVLLYASNGRAEHHEISRGWLSGALSGSETVIIPWVNVIAYLRLSTHPRLHEKPSTVSEALDFVRKVVAVPIVIHGDPDGQHLNRVADLLGATGRGGNLVNDAHLGALALQYDATVITFDNDFGRFPGVRWSRPTVD